LDACGRGLEVEHLNVALTGLKSRITLRGRELDKTRKQRLAREEKKAREHYLLQQALKQRKVHVKTTSKPPNMDDAVPKLSDPADAASTLSVPVLILYPLAEQTDLIKQFEENHSLNDHLAYIFPLPWDKLNEYVAENVDCYIGTPSGGLVKAGKKLSLRKIFETGKIEMVDGMLQVYVVPRTKAETWISTYKERKGKTL
jgi:hypothetical protein